MTFGKFKLPDRMRYRWLRRWLARRWLLFRRKRGWLQRRGLALAPLACARLAVSARVVSAPRAARCAAGCVESRRLDPALFKLQIQEESDPLEVSRHCRRLNEIVEI